jgi:hypothetical protein
MPGCVLRVVGKFFDPDAVQGEYLPVSFLQLVGQLKVAVALSIHPAFHPEGDY